jgi:hypothetical protein
MGMLLLVASAIAFVLGIAVMPWRAWQASHAFHPGLVVAIVAGCTFMGLGFGGATIGAVILLIQ